MYYECSNQVLKDLEKFKMMRVIKKQGPLVLGEIRSSFLDMLAEEQKVLL
jgi:hypothetical protein